MTRLTVRKTNQTRQIEEILGREFARIKSYRYNPAAIRVRVIDPRFAGKNRVDREEMVEPFLKHLPEDIYCDITVLLTLAPGEEKTSPMNYEFEHPSKPSL